MCGRCHKEGAGVSDFADVSQDSVLAHYSQSIHGEGLYQRGLTGTAVCSDCHTAHNVRNHNDPESTIHRDNVAATCQQCHGLIEKVHQKVIQGELWEKDPAQGARLHRMPPAPRSPAGLLRRGHVATASAWSATRSPIWWPPARASRASPCSWTTQVLRVRPTSKIRCIQCHTGATPNHERPCDTIPSRVDCSICHAEVVDIYKTSIHGKLDSQGDPDAPDCLVCHGGHDVLQEGQPRVADPRAQHSRPVRHLPRRGRRGRQALRGLRTTAWWPTTSRACTAGPWTRAAWW